MAMEIVDLPIENGGSFHSYVSWPEGIYSCSTIPGGAGFRNHPQYDGVADADDDHLFISNCQVGPELPTGPTCQKCREVAKFIQNHPKNQNAQKCQPKAAKIAQMKKLPKIANVSTAIGKNAKVSKIGKILKMEK